VRSNLTDPVLRLRVLSLMLLALITLAAFASRGRMWGVDHLAYFPVPIRLTAICLIVAAFVPALGRGMFSLTELIITRARAARRLRASLPFVAGLAALSIFVRFRAATVLWGDGQVVLNELGVVQDRAANLVHGIASIASFERIAPLTSMVYFVAGEVAHGVFHAEPATGIVAVACLLGALLVAIAARWLLADALPAWLACWLVLVLPSTGAVQLFFGYVENYSLLIFFGALFMGLIYRYMRGASGARAPVIAWLGASASHVAGLLFLPALLYVLAVRSGRVRNTRALCYALLAGVAVAAVAGRLLPASREFYRPFLSNADYAGVFSVAQAIRVTNLVLLLAPAFLVVAGWTAGRLRPEREETAPDGGTAAHALGLLLAPMMLFVVWFRAEIGMSRDWDVFALASTGLLAFTAWALTRPRHPERRRGLAAAAAPLVVCGMVLTVSWVGVNASTERSIARFERTLEYDRTNVAYAYETLARTYRSLARLPDAIEMMEQACAQSYNARRLVILGGIRRLNGDIEGAAAAYREVVERSPGYALARERLVALLFETEQWEELIAVAREGSRLFPQNAFYFYYLGQALIQSGHEAEGREALRQSQLIQLHSPSR